MTSQQQWFTAMIIALGTMLTRYIVFIIFPANKKPPIFIEYLGKVLPAAAIALIVVYSYKDLQVWQYPYGLPELIASLAVIALHAWKRNTLLSILIGTVLYMLLVQFIFI